MADEVVTLVWAFQPLDELEGRTGLIECEEALAQQLITADLAQDPRVGANHFREIVEAAPSRAAPSEQAYRTRVMQAEQQVREREAEAPRKSRGRPRKQTRGG
jgi:hypothetical protein